MQARRRQGASPQQALPLNCRFRWREARQFRLLGGVGCKVWVLLSAAFFHVRSGLNFWLLSGRLMIAGVYDDIVATQDQLHHEHEGSKAARTTQSGVLILHLKQTPMLAIMQVQLLVLPCSAGGKCGANAGGSGGSCRDSGGGVGGGGGSGGGGGRRRSSSSSSSRISWSRSSRSRSLSSRHRSRSRGGGGVVVVGNNRRSQSQGNGEC